MQAGGQAAEGAGTRNGTRAASAARGHRNHRRGTACPRKPQLSNILETDLPRSLRAEPRAPSSALLSLRAAHAELSLSLALDAAPERLQSKALSPPRHPRGTAAGDVPWETLRHTEGRRRLWPGRCLCTCAERGSRPSRASTSGLLPGLPGPVPMRGSRQRGTRGTAPQPNTSTPRRGEGVEGLRKRVLRQEHAGSPCPKLCQGFPKTCGKRSSGHAAEEPIQPCCWPALLGLPGRAQPCAPGHPADTKASSQLRPAEPAGLPELHLPTGDTQATEGSSSCTGLALRQARAASRLGAGAAGLSHCHN